MFINKRDLKWENRNNGQRQKTERSDQIRRKEERKGGGKDCEIRLGMYACVIACDVLAGSKVITYQYAIRTD